MTRNIIMLDVDAAEATQPLRSVPSTAEIRVISVTAHDVANDHHRALEAVCRNRETKPSEFLRLLKKMDTPWEGESKL